MQYKASKPESLIEITRVKRDEVLKKSQIQLESWIDENVQDMDDVRSYLKRLTRAVKVNIRFE